MQDQQPHPARKDLIIENTLTSSEQAQLLDWLESGTYRQVRERLHQPRPDGFALSVGTSTLVRFRRRARADEVPADHDEALSQARSFVAQPQEPELLEASALGLIRQRFFHAALSEEASAQELKHLFTILLKLKEDVRSERKLKVLEEKAASTTPGHSPNDIPAEFEEALRIAYSDKT